MPVNKRKSHFVYPRKLSDKPRIQQHRLVCRRNTFTKVCDNLIGEYRWIRKDGTFTGKRLHLILGTFFGFCKLSFLHASDLADEDFVRVHIGLREHLAEIVSINVHLGGTQQSNKTEEAMLT
ncbi:hypothetical protein GGP41_006900 [Bipolaris sorokiniana]|uniref:Uncharacterized protein n=1 Tax=Cochliobolus sativus TaxID=45130 RepID=A0A8H5ZR64_COCSA|nr:hypothetical protein GGP41_006900 [Bipolaris sorokiniana]